MVVIVVYCVLNLVVQAIIQPRFIGDAVRLSVTVTFLALVFWVWLLGPLGAILAIRLTILAKGLLVDIDPRTRSADALLRRRRPNRSRAPTAHHRGRPGVVATGTFGGGVHPGRPRRRPPVKGAVACPR